MAHFPNMGKALGLISSTTKTKLGPNLTGFQTIGGLKYGKLAKPVCPCEFKESNNSVKLSLDLQMHISIYTYSLTLANLTHVLANYD